MSRLSVAIFGKPNDFAHLFRFYVIVFLLGLILIFGEIIFLSLHFWINSEKTRIERNVNKM